MRRLKSENESLICQELVLEPRAKDREPYVACRPSGR
jgi:hypothetical protein